MAKTPVTIITGFLGAGKTTLIKNLLEQDHGKRIALIINEFGDIGVDGATLKACDDTGCSNVIELSNGCICCTVADDFIPTMETLLNQDNVPDHIIIETSGLALPQPLVQAFKWPEIRHRIFIDGIITVVDAPAVRDGQFAHDQDAVNAQRLNDDAIDHETPLEHLFKDQLECADMVLLNKVDDLSADDIDKVLSEVSGYVQDSTTPVLRATGTALNASILLGLNSHTKHQHDHDHSHSHDDEDHHDHDHDDFESFTLHLPAATDRQTIEEQIQHTLDTFSILRLKGFVYIQDKPMRLAVQAVGKRLDTWFEKTQEHTDTKGYLVVIGLHDKIDKEAIRAALLEHADTSLA